MDFSKMKNLTRSARALGSAAKHIGAATVDMGKAAAPLAKAALNSVKKVSADAADQVKALDLAPIEKPSALKIGLAAAAITGLGIATVAHFVHHHNKAKSKSEQKAQQALPAATKKGISSLGSGTTTYVKDYDPSLLEAFENDHPESDYMVTLRCPEFTTLCPITGQPDFATIYINYVPDELMVESKSLKLYLFSFREHGDFHEDVVNTIKNDLVALLQPKFIEVKGIFNPRGGISIYPYASWAKPGSGYEKVEQERMIEQLAEIEALS